MNSTSLQPEVGIRIQDEGDDNLVPEHGRSRNFALSAIEGVAESFQIRGVVSAVLDEILEDIEWTHSLNAGLGEKWSVQNLQHKLHVSSNELEERRAYDAHLKQEFREFGDKFVGELWALSFKITDLERDRSDSKVMSEQVDILTEQLARSEEMVRTLQRTMSLNREVYEENIIVSSDATGKNDRGQTVLTNIPSEDLSLVNAVSLSQNQATTDTAAAASNDVTVIGKVAAHKGTDPPVSQGDPTKSELEKQTDQSQNITSSNKEDSKFFLLNLDETTLLRVFSFLDALDVVNAALVNVAFYSKVDALFGLGNPVIQKDSDAGGLTAETQDVGRSEDAGSNAGIKISPDVEAGDTIAAKANPESDSQQQPKPVAVQGSVVLQGVATLPRKVESNETPSTVSQQQQPRNMLSNMLSKIGQQGNVSAARVGPGKTAGAALGPKAGGASNDDSSVTTTTTTATTSTETAKNFASMASSMAEKLSKAELSVILKMTQDLKAKDKVIVKTKAEREDLAARLEGTEAVKEFLISKVRDTERSLKKCQEDSIKVMQQISSDQEVISFLDTRVKDLELELQRTIADWNASKEELKIYQSKAENRQSVLEDMLQFERQQAADSEREWKSQKKVLVKEVKHCRAQVLALQAERGSFRQKNMQLKHALLSMNGGAGS